MANILPLTTYTAINLRVAQQVAQGARTAHTLVGHQRGYGFCETCQRSRPAKLGRRKGWKCSECVIAAYADTKHTNSVI